MLAHNHVNGVFQCVAVRAPGFGDRRLHKLEDIAAITGGAVYSRHSGFTLETMTHRAARPGRPGTGQRRPDRHHRRRRQPRRDRVPAHPDAGGAGAGHLRGRRGRADRADRRAVRARSRSSGSARRPTPNSRNFSTGSRTRCRRPGPRWPRGSSRAAARRCCTPTARWTICEVKDDYATGVEIVRRALTEPAFLIAANAGYSGQEVVDPDRAARRRRRVRRAARAASAT